MAEVFPFRGHRYNPEKISQIGDVVTQPYDKISPEMRQDYLKRHPYNIVRVIGNRDYQEAGKFLEEWIQSEILKQDESPSFYPYEQTFDFEGQILSRLGFFGLVSLEDSADSVKGHEGVLDEPLHDRFNLIRSTEANEGPVFMLYSDPSMETDQLLHKFKQNHDPLTKVVDEYGISHRLWQLPERDLHKQLSANLKSTQLYIADGHHRFRTSQLYFQECQDRGWKTASAESFDKRMIVLFNLNSPELKILPTHRGIGSLTEFDLGEFLLKLKPHFVVEKMAGLRQLEMAMKGAGVRIGLVAERNPTYHLLHLRESIQSDDTFLPGLTGVNRQLDVNVLHEGILYPLLGVDVQELSGQAHVAYFRHRDELISQVEQGHCQLAFLLNPTSLKEVHEIADQGEKMPQKSTDFYPKLLTGLVLMKMEIDKGG
ncbi:DUF1015 domain-containing protein [Acidobacteria bacterium AH-259-D05]|nr:DUF1015 domain-containing protein [Acidobacteria bacterium AH-259-D05]